jgi:hypothetical protein
MLAEPRVLDRRVRRDQIEQDAETAFVRRGHQRVEVAERAELRVDRRVVRNVVAEVREGRRVDGGQPEGIDAQPHEVIEPLRDPAKIAHAVAVGVLERPWIDLVDHRVTPPHGAGRIKRVRG